MEGEDQVDPKIYEDIHEDPYRARAHTTAQETPTTRTLAWWTQQVT